jgi:hypothetical protein
MLPAMPAAVRFDFVRPSVSSSAMSPPLLARSSRGSRPLDAVETTIFPPPLEIARHRATLSAVHRLRTRLGESLTAFKDVFRNPNLRRLELAWSAAVVGHWAYLVAVNVFAYQAGGATAVGVLVVIRMVPAALVAPFAATLADRYRRSVVMLTSNVVRAALIGAADGRTDIPLRRSTRCCSRHARRNAFPSRPSCNDPSVARTRRADRRERCREHDRKPGAIGP